MKEISFTGDGHRKPVQQKGIADSVFTVYVKFAARPGLPKPDYCVAILQ